MLLAIEGVVKLVPVANVSPPLAAAYQLITPALAVADKVSVPVPHLDAGVVAVILLEVTVTAKVLAALVPQEFVAVTEMSPFCAAIPVVTILYVWLVKDGHWVAVPVITPGWAGFGFATVIVLVAVVVPHEPPLVVNVKVMVPDSVAPAV